MENSGCKVPSLDAVSIMSTLFILAELLMTIRKILNVELEFQLIDLILRRMC